ncbi:MAG: sialate O-acetylesterase [Saprospirales bacterium]|nr:sialate O-acetylesterase [Saprospirales bacterium]
MALGLSTAPAFSQLEIAGIFSSHMVLQQRAQVPVWGRTAPGKAVHVRCSWLPEQLFSGEADAGGRWSVVISTPAGSLIPQQLEVSDGTEKIDLLDVLIGEVWLCSGQSNMEWPLEGSNYSPEQTRAAAYPHIRHIRIRAAVGLVPIDTVDAGPWQVCSDATAGHFTAVGYFFARDLADQYGVPVGLVNSSWGGSQVESWISSAGMAQSDLFKTYMDHFPKTWEEADARSLSKIRTLLFGAGGQPPDAATESAYLQPDFDVSGWKPISPTYAWDWQQMWAFRGSGHMVLDLELPGQAALAAASLHLGQGDGPAELYFNGVKIWSGKNTGAQEIAVPASVLKPGKNRLLLRQMLGTPGDWVEMGMRGAPGDYWLKTVAGRIPLASNWRAMPAFSEPFYFIHSSNNLGTAIYNAMIHPITRFPIKGVIWYQGESNAIRAHEYRQAFPLLIRDWRRAWGVEFPFLFVQLANWEASKGNSNTGSEWAELREAQTLALGLPRTGMAVAVDIGESNDIHPKNKHDVGKRLAREARRVAYGEPIGPGSPANPTVRFLGNAVEVRFQDAEPLVVRDKYGYVHGFEVAGEDRVFHYAKAEAVGATVLVQAAAVPHPVAVRYAWADDPNDVNLFTVEGFPIAPFRSDNWKGKTQGLRFE